VVLTKKAADNAERKEQYWRDKLRQWQESKKSQAEFCREQGINPNSFYGWKKVISERNAKAQSRAASARKESAPVESFEIDRPKAIAPAFVRLSIDCEDTVADKQSHSKQVLAEPNMLAEFIDAASGRRLRIFSSADESTVAALLAAISTR
jgi:transposase-like protein